MVNSATFLVCCYVWLTLENSQNPESCIGRDAEFGSIKSSPVLEFGAASVNHFNTSHTVWSLRQLKVCSDAKSPGTATREKLHVAGVWMT